mgnify:CR=1 FL=1
MTPTLETVRSKHNTGQLAITGRLLLQHSLLNLVGQVIPLLAGVATVPFIVRGLGPERFGLLSIAWVVLSYSAVFDLGLGRASTKFVAEALARGERERVSSIVAAAVTAQGILGVAGLGPEQTPYPRRQGVPGNLPQGPGGPLTQPPQRQMRPKCLPLTF